MRGGAWPKSKTAVPALLLATTFGIAGCSALGGITGAVAGAASGSASGNPGVGIAVAIAVRSAVDASLQTLDRRLHAGEQRNIAAQIGATPVGEESAWQVRHWFSYQDSQGRVRVLREFSTALVECREALFSVDDDDRDTVAAPLRFTTTVCREGQQQDWQWALAEPAVARWGALH